MTGASSFLYNYWYVIALSSEVSRTPPARNAEQEHLLSDRSVEVIKEDIKIIEGQKNRLGEKFFMVDVTEDAGQLAMRQMLSHLIAKELCKFKTPKNTR